MRNYSRMAKKTRQNRLKRKERVFYRCFRCKKLIRDNEHYYIFVEMKEAGEIKRDYCHKVCWDVFLKLVADKEESMGMLRNLRPSLQKMGLIPEEKVVIN